MSSTRADALLQIILIENKVKQISNSLRFRTIEKSIRILKNSSGKSIIALENPNNFDEFVQVRKNSKIAKEYLKTYELLYKEYTDQFTILNKRKNSYKAMLFGHR